MVVVADAREARRLGVRGNTQQKDNGKGCGAGTF
jgi:hypothetical protein